MSTITPYVTNNTTAAIHYIRGTGGSKQGDRAVYEWAQHTRPDSAINDFFRLRKAYGHQGAKRRPMGKYFEPDDPADATHIRIGKNWRESKPGETATHIRVVSSEAPVRRSEGIHYVHSFGLHEVNPEDQSQTQAAFESVKTLYQEEYPGLQVVMAAHLDSHGSKKAQDCGEGGKFHVHVVVNAVVYEEMSVGDRVYPRGNRVAGELNRIFEVWERNDTFLEERGHEFGLPKQALPSQKSKEGRAVRAGHSVYRAHERGEISPKEMITSEIEATFEELTTDLYRREVAALVDSDRIELFIDLLEDRGRVKASTRYVKSRDETVLRTFSVEGSKQRFGKHALGDRYANQGIQEQLEEIAQGRWKPLPELARLPPREIEAVSPEELVILLDEIENSPMVLEYEHMLQEAERARELEREHVQARKKIEADINAKYDALLQQLDGNLNAQRKRHEESAAVTNAGIEADQAALDARDAEIEARRARQRSYRKQRAVDPQAETERPSFLTPVEDFKPPVPVQRDEPVKAAPPQPLAEPVEKPVALPVMATHQQPLRGAEDDSKRAPILGFSDTTERSVDLIGYVINERSNGSALVVFEVAHTARQAHGQSGLLLKKERSDKIDENDNIYKKTTSEVELSASDYLLMKHAAGDQSVVTQGQKLIFSFAADLDRRTSGYVPILKTAQPSQTRPVLNDHTRDLQIASEHRVKSALAAGDLAAVTSEERDLYEQRQKRKAKLPALDPSYRPQSKTQESRGIR